MRDMETEDLVLVASILLTIAASWLDFVLGSTVFKIVKVLAPIVSLGVAIHKIRTSKPFVKDVPADAWLPIKDGYEYRILRSEHGRGNQPKPRLLLEKPDGYAEGMAEMVVNDDGAVIYRVNTPTPIRAEVRK